MGPGLSIFRSITGVQVSHPHVDKEALLSVSPNSDSLLFVLVTFAVKNLTQQEIMAIYIPPPPVILDTISSTYLLSLCTAVPFLILCLHYSLIFLRSLAMLLWLCHSAASNVSFKCSYFNWAVHTLNNRPLSLKSHLPSQHHFLQFYKVCIHSSTLTVLLLTSIYFAENDLPFFLANFYLPSKTLARLSSIPRQKPNYMFLSLSYFTALFVLLIFTDFMAIIWSYDINLYYSVFNLSSNVYFP